MENLTKKKSSDSKTMALAGIERDEVLEMRREREGEGRMKTVPGRLCLMKRLSTRSFDVSCLRDLVASKLGKTRCPASVRSRASIRDSV